AGEATWIDRIRLCPEGSGDRLDLLLQLFERAAHDETGGAALDEAGQRHRELDCEVVVHARRRRALGLEAVGAVEPPQHIALYELPRELAGRAGVVVLEDVADALAERRGAVLDAQPPALVVGLEDLGFLHITQPLG